MIRTLIILQPGDSLITITLFVDLEKKKTMFVAAGKDNLTVKAFVEDLVRHQGNADNVTDVSCDLSPAFIKGSKRTYLQQNSPLIHFIF